METTMIACERCDEEFTPLVETQTLCTGCEWVLKHSTCVRCEDAFIPEGDAEMCGACTQVHESPEYQAVALGNEHLEGYHDGERNPTCPYCSGVLCVECGEPTTVEAITDADGLKICRECDYQAGVAWEHAEGYHTEHPTPECGECAAGAPAPDLSAYDLAIARITEARTMRAGKAPLGAVAVLCEVLATLEAEIGRASALP